MKKKLHCEIDQKKTRDYDAYEKYLKVNQLEKLVNFCADNIVARAQKQAKVDKVKIIAQTASKMHNTKMMETRAANQKVQQKKSL